MPLEGAISATTRTKRQFEVDGVDYFFWDKGMFQQEVAKGSFLEWAEVYGNYYGTLISEVDARRRRGAGAWKHRRCGRPPAADGADGG